MKLKNIIRTIKLIFRYIDIEGFLYKPKCLLGSYVLQ